MESTRSARARGDSVSGDESHPRRRLMRQIRNVIGLTLFATIVNGCTVGPNYKRPQVVSPDVYRGLTTDQAAQPQTTSFADQKWWEVFQDQQLQELIRTARQQNYDVRIAAARILQARAQL